LLESTVFDLMAAERLQSAGHTFTTRHQRASTAGDRTGTSRGWGSALRGSVRVTLTIHSIDLFVLIVYLAGVAGIGMWLGRGTHELAGYLLGDRQLPWWAILGSIVATETSTATFLSVPGIAFAPEGDLRFLQLAIGYLAGRMLIRGLLLPLYFRAEIFTAYQVLDQRFGGATKRAASLIFLVTRNLSDGLRLFLAAIVLEKMIQLPLPACVVLIGLVTILYTLVGGIKAVIWNDCVQFVIYMLGALVAGWIILQSLPEGIHGVVQFGRRHEKFQLFDFSWDVSDPYTFWAAVLGGMFLTLGTHGTDQMMVQRYLCAKSQTDAARALVWSAVVVLIQFAVFLLLGIGLAAFYAINPRGERFLSNDEVFATFIVQELPAGRGLVGLVLAAVFAAAMSTLSSSINSSATSAVKDLWPQSAQGHDAARRQLRASRIATIGFGLLQIVIGIAAQDYAKSVVNDVLAIASFSAGLLLGIFALGVFAASVRQTAAAVGLMVGLTCLLAVKYGLPELRDAWLVAWTWLPAIGAATTFVGGLLAQRLIDFASRRQ
jgi:SSS family transporter